jgi:hypothetical protein
MQVVGDATVLTPGRLDDGLGRLTQFLLLAGLGAQR